jgi:pyruvate dehydrogenase E1 component alpha subunit
VDTSPWVFLLLKKVFEGTVNYLQILDESGNVDSALFPKDLDDAKIVEMYKYMSFARALDAKVLSLQRQGRALTYAPLVGQEGEQIGSALAMRKDDLFVPNFRQHGVYLARGMPLETMMLGWKGFEEGNIIPKEVGGFPMIIPVSTQVPHAAGIAFAQKYMKKDVAVIAYIGDGGTSEGDFYEALNFSGVFKLPLIVIIENNQWAISVPRSKQSAAETLAQKGIAAGIDVIQVDGNDVIAVYKAVRDAIGNSKNGPTLIECVTYRMSMHTTADDPTRYRSDDEVEAWRKKDPIARVRTYLNSKKLWNDNMEGRMQEEQTKKIDAAVEKAEKFVPDPKSIFEHVYSYIPQTLKEELDASVESGFFVDK